MLKNNEQIYHEKVRKSISLYKFIKKIYNIVTVYPIVLGILPIFPHVKG
jgi:hypothetical protein